eukprot:9497892-Pyramimonas_sp.AAC.1
MVLPDALEAVSIEPRRRSRKAAEHAQGGEAESAGVADADAMMEEWMEELIHAFGEAAADCHEGSADDIDEGVDVGGPEGCALDPHGHDEVDDDELAPHGGVGEPPERDDAAPIIQRCSESRKAVEDAKRRAAAQSPGSHPLRHGVISLIKIGDHAQFVRWAADEGRCRQISLDSQDRVITIVAGPLEGAPIPPGPPRVPLQDLRNKDYAILARDTEAIMFMTTRKGRPPMTPWALKLAAH